MSANVSCREAIVGRTGRFGRRCFAIAAVLVLAPLAAASAETKPARSKPYEPVSITVAAAVTPDPDLVATAARLLAAVQARDVEATAALVADDVTVVSGGLSITGKRTAEKKAVGTDPAAILSFVGMNGGGDWDLPRGVKPEKITEMFHGFAFAHIEQALTPPIEWGRDPLVPGAVCTYRAETWDGARIARSVGPDAGTVSGMRFDEATPARATPAADGRVVATLPAGRMVLQASETEFVEGWRAVRLPKGGTGWVEADRAKDVYSSGICFLPNVAGGWLMSAVAGVSL